MNEWWKNELYSQFGEDSILFSYFRSKAFAKTLRISDIDLGRGFYVDIGCHHPYMISNTWFFYQRGWRGINVDPVPGVKADFDLHRPDDINLEVAIAKEDGEATLYSQGPRSVQNSLVPFEASERYTVPTMRLDTLLNRYLPPACEIDILSVDVEGLDMDVLRSNDWTKYRPEMVVVEHHEGAIQKVISSEVFEAMTRWGYALYGWAQPSLIFRRL
jgi:FkbM family methyltransferase